jgi:cytochrome c-type biogenesis protein CcmE
VTADLTPRPVAPVPSARRRRRWLPMLVLGLVLVAGGVIVTQFLTSAVDYYCNVDEIGTRAGCDADRRLRVQGTVDEGSVELANGVTTFDISFDGATLPVRYEGEPGGIFKECLPVVVHGRLIDGTFEGDRVEVKHSNEYVAENGDRVDEAESSACPPTDGGA